MVTHDKMELGVRLEGVVQGDQEREVPDGLQHTTLGESVLQYLLLPHYRLLLEYLHGVQLAPSRARVRSILGHANKEHLSIAWGRRRGEGEREGVCQSYLPCPTLSVAQSPEVQLWEDGLHRGREKEGE